ncbi:MAG: class I SAM-dependent methyltransferase [bacterium]|nr:class I SAM-dependent methyltransferase [bacterium]
MDKITKEAQEMYNKYQFGEFNYGPQRLATEPLLEKFLEGIRENAFLFDIGCGAGFWTGVYLEKGIAKEKITLLDLAPDNITQLREKGFKAEQGSVLELPFADNVADYTICNGVIHHTIDPLKAFLELVRITKPGGSIYLNVYNAWNPYFYLVHKATFLIRYCYWHWTKRIVNIIFPLAQLLFQPLALVVFGKLLDKRTGLTMFMDQVITPRAYLFTRKKIREYAALSDCEVEQCEYNKHYLMIAGIIKVSKGKIHAK